MKIGTGHRRRLAAALAVVACAHISLPVSAANVTGGEISPSVGLYLSIPLGGADRRDWRDRTEFSIAMRGNFAGTDITGRPLTVQSADLAALRFNRHGLDRMQLSGRDYYFRDGGISLYADGEDGEKSGSNWMIYAGVGLVVLGGLTIWGVTAVNNLFCDDEWTNDHCDD